MVSNTEPDLKSFPWIIYFRSKDEAIAISEWIKARGYDFKFFVADYIKAAGYFTNTYNGDVTPTTQLLCGKTFPVCGKTVRHEIVLDLEVKIMGAKFPAIEPKKTEKQLEIESIRRDQEALAARLKKLETE